MEDLKSKVINSTFWSFVDTFGNQGLQFVVGIILARLLLPEDYGLIGVLTIFIGVSGVLVDSGFKTSIIRSKDIKEVDCSTIFFINILVSGFVAMLLFFSAKGIAFFFGNQDLINVTRAFALIPVINGFGLVQSALLFKNLKFKRNAIISLVSNLIAGGTAIILAFKGFSYWALVLRSLLVSGIYNILIWITSDWHPQFVFSIEVLKKHFRFSSRLLSTGIIDAFFDNIYTFIFGKFFTLKDLGFFTRGKGYADLVTKSLSIAIQKVNTPLLAASDQDQVGIIKLYFKLLRLTCLFIFPLAVLLAVVSKPLIIILIGEKWLPAALFIQILVIPGMVYPIHNANSSLFEVMGKSKIILKSALISRPIQIVILAISSCFGAHAITSGIALHSVFVLFLTSCFAAHLIKINLKKIIKNFLPAISISIIMGFIVSIVGLLFKNNFSIEFLLIIQLTTGFISIIFLMNIFARNDFINIIQIVIPKYKREVNSF